VARSGRAEPVEDVPHGVLRGNEAGLEGGEVGRGDLARDGQRRGARQRFEEARRRLGGLEAAASRRARSTPARLW
jgi:hypothetical protein